MALARPASFLVTLLVAFPVLLYGQTASEQGIAGIPWAVQLPHHAPMKTGQLLACRLLYPVYIDNQLAIPAGVKVRGAIVRLDPDASRRVNARFHGDFTPFHTPVVQFDEVVFADGTSHPIVSAPATNGVPVLRLSPPPGRKPGGFLARQWEAAKDRAKETAAMFTAPGRGDRLVQYIYRQLPYHPQRVESGTTWTVELAQPLDLKLSPVEAQAEPAAPAAEQSPEWQLRAYLDKTISSAKQKPGDRFQARVSEPVFNAEHALVVPQGAVLVGEVTQAKAARSFSRQGKLRFKFREIQLPGGFSQPVQANVTAIDSDQSANLQVDSEGAVQPKPRNRVLAPLVLTLLAGRALDDDGSRAVDGAVASNGFGIVGRVVGILAGSRNVAAGIGIYGAALAFYDLWLAHGKDVVFVKNTRIEVSTTPARSQLNTP